MAKITIHELTKAYGGQDLFADLSLEVHSGTRLALVGPNGCGKSTLLKIIAGQVEPDRGGVHIFKGAQLGFVRQELDAQDLEQPLEDFVLEVLPSWSQFWRQWRRAMEQHDEQALAQLAVEQQELEHHFGYNPEYRAQAILSGLGFEPHSFTRPVGQLSGGWRERAKLARVLVAGADILLLDEPTNHLDLQAVEWLETYIQSFEGILIFVAHDRYFLDRTANKVLFFSADKPILRNGNFSQFLVWQNQRQEQFQRQAQKLSTEINRKQVFVDRFRAKATKARQAQSRVGQIARLEDELNALPQESKRRTLSFTWPEPPRGNQCVLSVVDLDFSFPDASLLHNLNFNIYQGQKIALVGPNGQGKSTLLKLIMGQLDPGQGRIVLGSNIVPGYFSQHQTEILNPLSTTLAEIRRLSAPQCSDLQLKSVLGLFLLGEGYWDKQVQELSGGEKNRLVLSSIFMSQANFLILDEPTNHLDMESREALITALEAYTGTILVVAHDRYLLQEIASEIWELHPEHIEVYACSFDQYLAQKKEKEAAQQTQAQEPRLVRQDQKEKKRLEAQERNRLYQALKPLRQEFADLEQKLEVNLEEQEELEKILAEPTTYADPEYARDLGIRFNQIEDQAEVLMGKLARLEDQIQDLENQRQELGVD